MTLTQSTTIFNIFWHCEQTEKMTSIKEMVCLPLPPQWLLAPPKSSVLLVTEESCPSEEICNQVTIVVWNCAGSVASGGSRDKLQQTALSHRGAKEEEERKGDEEEPAEILWNMLCFTSDFNATTWAAVEVDVLDWCLLWVRFIVPHGPDDAHIRNHTEGARHAHCRTPGAGGSPSATVCHCVVLSGQKTAPSVIWCRDTNSLKLPHCGKVRSLEFTFSGGESAEGLHWMFSHKLIKVIIWMYKTSWCVWLVSLYQLQLVHLKEDKREMQTALFYFQL